MITFLQYLEEKNAGVEYEERIRKVLRGVSSEFPNIKVARGTGKGALSAHDVDMTLKINNKPYNIEIKKNIKAQMGGISINYDYQKKEFWIKDKVEIDDETKELILETIESKKKDIDNTIEYFRANDPIFKYNKKIGFPLNVSHDIWRMAVDQGIVKNLNEMIKNNEKFISQYYKNKNVFYIQIGDSGLFYLSKNPLNLDIPQIQGEVNIEFRAGKSGVKLNKTHNYEYSTITLRVIGRAKFKGKSKYSLDDQSNVMKLFSQL